MLDTGATTGVAGDSPGICGGRTSTGWQCGELETWSISGGAQGRILATCAVVLPQRCREAAAVQFHLIAMEDMGGWVRQEGVALDNCPGVAVLVIDLSNMTTKWWVQQGPFLALRFGRL
jgi:hypothetical protein